MEEEQQGLIKEDAHALKATLETVVDKNLYKREARRKALDFAMVEIKEGRNNGKTLIQTAEEIFLWLMGEK